jgi:soluble lytic murein transglycosylase
LDGSRIVVVMMGGVGLVSLLLAGAGIHPGSSELQPAVAALKRWRTAWGDDFRAVKSGATHPIGGESQANGDGQTTALDDGGAWVDSVASPSVRSSVPAGPPPLSSRGPGSWPSAFKPLKDYSFLTETELLDPVLSDSDKEQPALDKAFRLLRASMVGSQKEKRAAAKQCADVLDSHPVLAGSQFDGQLDADLLGCGYFWLKRLVNADDLERQREKRAEKQQIEEELLAAGRQDKRRARFPARIRGQSEWDQLVGMTYAQGLSRLKVAGKKDAMRLAQFAIHSSEPCQTTGARSALMRNMEEYLPDDDVFETIYALYIHQQNCLHPGDASFEEIHLRTALLLIERGRLADAGSALSYALQDMKGSEVVRVLFWRGLIEALREPRRADTPPGSVALNRFWSRLLEQHPLSFHALVVDSITGYGLHQRIVNRATPWVGLFHGEDWSTSNVASLLFAWMIARKDARMQKVYGKFIIRSVHPQSFEQGLFLGLAQNEAGFTRGMIKALFTSVSRFGRERVNLEVLDILYPRFFRKELDKHGNSVDIAFALSLMRQESSFNPRATSGSRAKGLMQVLPSTARMVTRKRYIDLYDPVQNIQAGTLYLKRLLRQYSDNYVHTISSYNAGPGKVVKWKRRYVTKDPLLFADLIPYRETRDYVVGLLRNIHWYRVLLNEDDHLDLVTSTDSSSWTARSLVPDPAQWGFESLESPIRLVFDEAPVLRP